MQAHGHRRPYTYTYTYTYMHVDGHGPVLVEGEERDAVRHFPPHPREGAEGLLFMHLQGHPQRCADEDKRKKQATGES